MRAPIQVDEVILLGKPLPLQSCFCSKDVIIARLHGCATGKEQSRLVSWSQFLQLVEQVSHVHGTIFENRDRLYTEARKASEAASLME